MRNPKNLKPIEYRQLCALVKGILLQDHTIDDAEWKAQAHQTMATWGFAPVSPEELSRAMTQVEYALRRTVGIRPVRDVPIPTVLATTAPPAPAREGRTSRPAGWDTIVALMARLKASTGSGPLSAQQPGPREVLQIDEDDAVNEFWRAVQEPGADKIALLRAFAEIAIVRPAGWDYLGTREQADQHQLSADRCFGCGVGDRALAWHHVIQIQHGGSNYLRNRVAICEVCHAAIHPWLPPKARKVNGFVSTGELYQALEAQRRKERA